MNLISFSTLVMCNRSLFMGLFEIKRPSTSIISTPRANTVILSRAAETAIQQTESFLDGNPIIIPRNEKYLFLGNQKYMFIIIGRKGELITKLGELFQEMVSNRLPKNLQILPYDSLLTMFESRLRPKVLVLSTVDASGRAPLIRIPISEDIVRQLKTRRNGYDIDYQLAEAELGDAVHGFFAGSSCGVAGAGGEAMENFDGLLFSESLKTKQGWCLHAAHLASGILLRAGYLVGLSDEEPVQEQFKDEISWIFQQNQNEVWVGGCV